MKIGILTLPLHTNYGGILQAYALQNVLERMGHKVEVLQKRETYFNYNKLLMPAVYAHRIIKKLFDKNVKIFYEQCNKKNKLTRESNTKEFIHKHIHLREFDSVSEIRPDDYGAIIVGSDQIWRRIYYDRKYKFNMFSIDPEDAFLKFGKNWPIKKIAYAASFGVNDWEYSEAETKNISLLIKQFDRVSVREKAGVDNCRLYLGCEAMHVLDPTMLLSRDDYMNIVEIPDGLTSYNNQRVFCYILDSNNKKDRIINHISEKFDLAPFFVGGDMEEDAVRPAVEDWIRSFSDASLIITDSFHACVFSIIFNKPFIAIGNSERGISRFESLLGIFGLQDKLIDESTKDIPDLVFDWNHINMVLSEWREKSLNFLKSIL